MKKSKRETVRPVSEQYRIELERANLELTQFQHDTSLIKSELEALRSGAGASTNPRAFERIASLDAQLLARSGAAATLRAKRESLRERYQARVSWEQTDNARRTRRSPAESA